MEEEHRSPVRCIATTRVWKQSFKQIVTVWFEKPWMTSSSVCLRLSAVAGFGLPLRAGPGSRRPAVFWSLDGERWTAEADGESWIHSYGKTQLLGTKAVSNVFPPLPPTAHVRQPRRRRDGSHHLVQHVWKPLHRLWPIPPSAPTHTLSPKTGEGFIFLTRIQTRKTLFKATQTSLLELIFVPCFPGVQGGRGGHKGRSPWGLREDQTLLAHGFGGLQDHEGHGGI